MPRYPEDAKEGETAVDAAVGGDRRRHDGHAVRALGQTRRRPRTLGLGRFVLRLPALGELPQFEEGRFRLCPSAALTREPRSTRVSRWRCVVLIAYPNSLDIIERDACPRFRRNSTMFSVRPTEVSDAPSRAIRCGNVSSGTRFRMTGASSTMPRSHFPVRRRNWPILPAYPLIPQSGRRDAGRTGAADEGQ